MLKVVIFVAFMVIGGTDAAAKRITNENWREILEGEWMVKL